MRLMIKIKMNIITIIDNKHIKTTFVSFTKPIYICVCSELHLPNASLHTTSASPHSLDTVQINNVINENAKKKKSIG